MNIEIVSQRSSGRSKESVIFFSYFMTCLFYAFLLSAVLVKQYLMNVNVWEQISAWKQPETARTANVDQWLTETNNFELRDDQCHVCLLMLSRMHGGKKTPITFYFNEKII